MIYEHTQQLRQIWEQIHFFSNRCIFLVASSSVVCPQTVSSVDESHSKVLLSRSMTPWAPFGGRCFGQLVNMWSTVCNGSPHSNWALSVRPQCSMEAPKSPTPNLRQLSVIHCLHAYARYICDHDHNVTELQCRTLHSAETAV